MLSDKMAAILSRGRWVNLMHGIVSLVVRLKLTDLTIDVWDWNDNIQNVSKHGPKYFDSAHSTAVNEAEHKS